MHVSYNASDTLAAAVRDRSDLVGRAGIVTGFLAFTRGRNANVAHGKVTGLIGIGLSLLATLISIGYFIFVVVSYTGLFAIGQGSR